MNKVCIIAEIGINHQGNINLAHELIRQAAMCGADVAKFQAYSVDKLFHPEFGEDPNNEIWQGVKPLEFNQEQFAKLKTWCDEEGLEFMCSVFDEERLQWMEQLDVKRHKIASRISKLNPTLAMRMIETGKECLMSLGFNASRLSDNFSNLKYLACVSEYPTEYKKVFIPEFGVDKDYWGFSDHSLGIEASLIAVARGARIIEKHFTLNKGLPGFDHVCSITPDELFDLVKYTRRMERILYT